MVRSSDSLVSISIHMPERLKLLTSKLKPQVYNKSPTVLHLINLLYFFVCEMGILFFESLITLVPLHYEIYLPLSWREEGFHCSWIDYRCMTPFWNNPFRIVLRLPIIGIRVTFRVVIGRIVFDQVKNMGMLVLLKTGKVSNAVWHYNAEVIA